MGVCELCGSEQSPTHRTNTSGANIDACMRCIERLGLPKQNITQLPKIRTTKIPILRNSSNDIMAKSGKELAPDFHNRIREARTAKGWDQREFARRMNERLNIVQRTENGNRPTDDLIKKIEKVLDVRLFVDAESANTRPISTSDTRNMTIGDAYDDLLSRRD